MTSAAPRYTPGISMLLILAILGGSGSIALGLLFASEATVGVALIGLGCFCAICGRIFQAAYQHKELLRVLGAQGTLQQ